MTFDFASHSVGVPLTTYTFTSSVDWGFSDRAGITVALSIDKFRVLTLCSAGSAYLFSAWRACTFVVDPYSVPRTSHTEPVDDIHAFNTFSVFADSEP